MSTSFPSLQARSSQSARSAQAALFLVFVSIAVLAPGGSPGKTESRGVEASILVGFHLLGPHAIGDCAQSLWTRRESFSSAAADGSTSLDEWREKYHVRRISALFRVPDGTSLEAQTERLVERLNRSGGEVGRQPRSAVSDFAHIYQVDIADPKDIPDAVEELRADPHVTFAQINHIHRLDFDPDDPFLATSGSWGQTFPDLWGLDRIRAREAWQITRGEGQIVAVVDTGLDYLHPDITGNVWINPGEDLNANGTVDPSDFNGLDDDGNGFIDDLRGFDFSNFGRENPDGTIRLGDPDPFDELGHGTHVSGTIAAVANNGIGIAGIAPEARIMALKGFDRTGRGRDSDLWRAVLYAIENGASVINASWSCRPACPDNPLADAVLGLAESAGAVFVTSAGNEAFDVIRNNPERTSSAITVGSIGIDDEISGFSNRGWLLDLLAPGGGPGIPLSVLAARRNILSLASASLPETELPFLVGSRYYRLAGTSMSAPHVAGAIALLRSIRPNLSPQNVRRLLRIAARDVGEPGHDPIHGAGVLDVARLIDTPLPELDLAIESPLPGTIFDPLAGPVPIHIRATGRDLMSASLAISRGLERRDFLEVETAQPLTGETRVEWDASASTVGPYVVRLRAELRDGRRVDEFTIISLERTKPVRLSRDNVDERYPSISGRRVAWQVFPDGSLDSSRIRLGGFARHRGVRRPTMLSASEATQTNPTVSGHRVVWLESMTGQPATRLHGCILQRAHRDGSDPACKASLLFEGVTRLDPIRMALHRILWSPRIGIQFSVLGCRWFGERGRRGGSCVPRPIVAERLDTPRRLLDFDGRTAVFVTNQPDRHLEICSSVLAPGSCDPRPVLVQGFPLRADGAAIDRDLLVFEIIRPDGSILGHCRVDRATGVCQDPRLIEGVENGSYPDVSGRRVIWTEFSYGERSSIWLCEIDDVNGRCDPMRLTGSHAPASRARIDRHRIVWEDERFGPSQILGLQLPSIRIARRLRTKPGKRTNHLFWATGGSGGRLTMTIEAVSGPTPEMWNARIRSLGSRRAVLMFQPPSTPPGNEGSTATWRIRGTAANGLQTERSITIDAVGYRRRKAPSKRKTSDERFIRDAVGRHDRSSE